MGAPKERSHPDIPDLDVPASRDSSRRISAPESGLLARVPAPPALDPSGDDDELGMEIQRGGALMSAASSSTVARPRDPKGPVRVKNGSGLDVAYQRSDLQRRAAVVEGPSRGEKLLAYGLTILPCVATAALLLKLAHHRGRSIIGLLPHAFDASSTIQSGAFALVALAAAIGLGFIGVKAHPRSYAMVGSAGMLLIASLAMVTVTLVSTEESATPPDGALLIPYVVPLALLLLGVGIAGRGIGLFLQGGARRAATILAAAIGGALVFAAIELSAIASRLL